MPLKGFPKQITSAIAPSSACAPWDEKTARILGFFRRLVAGRRQFLKDDVTRQDIIETWSGGELRSGPPILAEVEGRIVGDATLHRQAYGWMRHVGEIRVVTDAYSGGVDWRPPWRGRIFYVRCREAWTRCGRMGVDQVAAIKVFQKLGSSRRRDWPITSSTSTGGSTT